MSAPGRDDPDEGHDAWLREALRHAPDASAAPPAALREAILARARAAATASGPKRPTLADRIGWLWAALARPPVAAGFASVMAATLVGMMWWDRPIDQTLPSAPPLQSIEPASPRATAPVGAEAPAVAGNAAAPAAPVPPVPPAAPTAGASGRSAPPAAALPAAPDAPATPSRSDVVAESRTAQPQLKDVAPPAQEAARQAPQAFPEPARKSVDSAADRRDAERSGEKREAQDSLAKLRSEASRSAETATREAAPAAAPVARAQDRAAAPAPAETTAPGAAKPFPAAPPAPASPDAAESGLRDNSSAGSGFAGAGAKQSAADAEPARRRLAASAASAPMAPLLAALAADPARWSRQGEGGDGAVDPALQAWLARVDAAARTGWMPVSEDEAKADAAAQDGRSLRLLRDGRVVATLRLQGDRAVFESRLGAPAERWSAALSPGTAARLQASLPAAPR